MKKKWLAILFIIILVCSIGIYYFFNIINAGSVGRFKEYNFNTSKKELQEAINSIAFSHSNLDTINYNDYYNKIHNEKLLLENDFKEFGAQYKYLIISSEKKYIYRYQIYESNIGVNLKLISAEEYGTGFKLAKNITSAQKNIYSSIFEKEVINKLSIK